MLQHEITAAGAGKMAEWLRVLSALAKDQVKFPTPSWQKQLSGMHETLGLSPRTAEEEKLTYLEWVLFEVLDL